MVIRHDFESCRNWLLFAVFSETLPGPLGVEAG